MASTEDMAATKVDMVVAMEDEAARHATLAVVTATCLETAPKAKSATTAAKLVTFHVTAHLRPLVSELATSASSQVTSRLNAPTRLIFEVFKHATHDIQ